MLPSGAGRTKSFPDHTEAGYCVFLCESDGRVIHDFGDAETSDRSLVPAPVLPGLIGHDRMLDFLALVEAGGAAPGCQISIGREGPAGSLVMRGTQTPYGTLVFAVLPATGEHTTEAIRTGTHLQGHDDAVAQCAALRKHEEDTSRILREAVHDLKNPISSIIGSCEYLTQYCEDDPVAEHLEIISGMEASARMLLQLSGRLAQLCGLSGPVVSGE